MLLNEPDFPVIVQSNRSRGCGGACRQGQRAICTGRIRTEYPRHSTRQVRRRKITLPLNPPCGTMATTLAPVEPCVIVMAVGVAASVKAGFGFGQLFTRFAALMVPIPVAKSQPVVVA